MGAGGLDGAAREDCVTEELARHLLRGCALLEEGIGQLKDGVLAEDWMLRVTAFDESLRALPTVAFAGAGTDPNARTGLEAFHAARAAFHEVAERRMEDLQQALSGIEDSRKALRVYLDAARRAAMEPHYINRGY